MRIGLVVAVIVVAAAHSRVQPALKKIHTDNASGAGEGAAERGGQMMAMACGKRITFIPFCKLIFLCLPGCMLLLLLPIASLLVFQVQFCCCRCCCCCFCCQAFLSHTYRRRATLIKCFRCRILYLCMCACVCVCCAALRCFQVRRSTFAYLVCTLRCCEFR